MTADDATTDERFIAKYGPAIAALGGLEFVERVRDGAVTVCAGGITARIDFLGAFDPAAELARLTKAIASRETEVAPLAARLDNASFMSQAPAAVVEDTRRRLAEAEADVARMCQARLGLLRREPSRGGVRA